jgi:glycosyltransferase involved in cell wall biosynthesis
MRICFVTNLNSIHAVRWIQPMIDANHEVYVVSYGNNNLPLTGAKEVIDMTRHLNLRKIRFLLWGMWLRGYVQKIHPDILHAHQISAAGWIGAITGFHPFVVTGWGSDILIEPQKSLLRKLLTKIVLAQTDYLTVPSKIMYNTARDLGYPEERLYLIPWGVETDIFKPNPLIRLKVRQQLNLKENTIVLFCPRGIDPIYNLDIVLEASHSFLPDLADFRLILLKYNIKPEYLKMLEQQIISLNMEANVIWLPAQNSVEDMASLYQTSDVVISIPSSEGYGFTTYESMACGVPTIISDLPVFTDELQDNVHILKVPIRDTNKTAEALKTLVSNNRLRQTLIENSILKCSNLCVQDRINQVETLYKYIQEPM